MVSTEKKSILSQMLTLLEPVWEPAAWLQVLLDWDNLDESTCDELSTMVQESLKDVNDQKLQQQLNRLNQKIIKIKQQEAADRQKDRIEAKKHLSSLDI